MINSVSKCSVNQPVLESLGNAHFLDEKNLHLNEEAMETEGKLHCFEYFFLKKSRNKSTLFKRINKQKYPIVIPYPLYP